MVDYSAYQGAAITPAAMDLNDIALDHSATFTLARPGVPPGPLPCLGCRGGITWRWDMGWREDRGEDLAEAGIGGEIRRIRIVLVVIALELALLPAVWAVVGWLSLRMLAAALVGA